MELKDYNPTKHVAELRTENSGLRERIARLEADEMRRTEEMRRISNVNVAAVAIMEMVSTMESSDPHIATRARLAKEWLTAHANTKGLGQ